MNIDFTSPTIAFISIIIAFLIAFTFHEFSHALTAYLLGDDTAKKAGRLTLNPLAHIDPFGFLFLILFRIGWGKPVPMNIQNFKYPRIYGVLSGFAGPFSNLILALLALYAHKYFGVTKNISAFFYVLAYMNVMLGVFNLLPVPPLDGSHLIFALIPASWRQSYARLQLIFLLLLFIILFFPTTQLLLIMLITKTFDFLNSLVI